MNTCCLCRSLAASPQNEMWNRPLFESDSFVALPSLGSLVEGWLLLVPKKHYLNMGSLPEEMAAELEVVKHKVAFLLQAKYGHVCAFEHGPGAPNKKVGCSVDHAHIHLVPIDFDLIEVSMPYFPPGIAWSAASWADCREASKQSEDYLYVEQPVGRGRIAVDAAFGSQIFRKAIASKLGVPNRFNWREYPAVEIAARTIQGIGAEFEREASVARV